MKNSIYIVGLLIMIFGTFSCTKDKVSEVNFKDQNKNSIYSYIAANKEDYSSFLSIIDKGGISGLLSAYNPEAEGYTLFLPDNKAVEKFIQESGKYSSLDDLLNDKDFITLLCRYHVVKSAIKSDNFPFGAFSAYTLSGDLLTVSFISETDTSYFKINNQAPVIKPNIKTSNGFIHAVSSMLIPINFTTYYWLEHNKEYSIFKDAVDATGLKALFSTNVKYRGFTLLLENDSIFQKREIYSIQDLEKLVSPGSTDYTNPLNPLYNFVTYHMLNGNIFLNGFENNNTNYTTLSDIPVLINGLGKDIMINKGREVYDTIVKGIDSTFIDYIGINYDASNVQTESGVIHFIDQVLTQKSPIMATQSYGFGEESFLNYLSRKGAGTYLIEDSTQLNYIKYSGSDLFFVTGESTSTAWGHDYLMMNGDFSISYTIPKIVQGVYNVYLRADASNTANAVIQVYIDGKSIGGLINLKSGGASYDPFVRPNATATAEQSLGTFTFVKYEQHTIVIKSLIPGRLLWDTIRFEPKQ
jgi:uncharacterized surface protein with fasciclin (FAS1) repeats